jgi:hypothetical protein
LTHSVAMYQDNWMLTSHESVQRLAVAITFSIAVAVSVTVTVATAVLSSAAPFS